MKKQLYLYLFIIAALMNVFTYIYFTRKQDSKAKNITSTNDGTVTVTTSDSLKIALEQLRDANYFALETNDNAKEYFYNSNLNFEQIIPKVKDALLEYNANPEGNKYTDQAKYGNKVYLINKIKILNHRWIIADYSNGDLWGEVLLKYFIEENGTVSFETIETYLYPKQE